MLYFLSRRYNEGEAVCFQKNFIFRTPRILTWMVKWSDPSVWQSLLSAFIFLILFLIIEVFIAVEPVLPPFLLVQKVPVLVGCSNALVAVCNLSVTYFFPVWFQTVMLSSASTAGKYHWRHHRGSMRG